MNNILSLNKIIRAEHINTAANYIKKILIELNYVLLNNTIGNCLTSNQLGYNDCRLIIVNVDGKILQFVNPTVTPLSDQIYTITESTLSLPNKIFESDRYSHISVSAENLKQNMELKVSDNSIFTARVSSAIQLSLEILNNK